MVTKSPVKTFKMGRTLVAYERIHEPQSDDQDRINKTFHIVLKINPVAEAEGVRQERERIAKC